MSAYSNSTCYHPHMNKYFKMNPCYRCDKHEMGCNCVRRKAWKALYDGEKARIMKIRKNEAVYHDVVISSICKSTGKRPPQF